MILVFGCFFGICLTPSHRPHEAKAGEGIQESHDAEEQRLVLLQISSKRTPLWERFGAEVSELSRPFWWVLDGFGGMVMVLVGFGRV